MSAVHKSLSNLPQQGAALSTYMYLYTHEPHNKGTRPRSRSVALSISLSYIVTKRANRLRGYLIHAQRSPPVAFDYLHHVIKCIGFFHVGIRVPIIFFIGITALKPFYRVFIFFNVRVIVLISFRRICVRGLGIIMSNFKNLLASVNSNLT